MIYRYSVLACVSLLVLIITPSAYAKAPAIPPSRLQAFTLSAPFTLTYLLTTSIQHTLPGMPNDVSTKPVKYMVTLSYNGSSLLYRDVNIESKVAHTVVYDGKKMYSFYGNSRVLSVYPGFDFTRMTYAPIPGLGIPHLPLLAASIPASAESPDVEKLFSDFMVSEKTFVLPSLINTMGVTQDTGISELSDAQSQQSHEAFGIVGSVEEGVGQSKILWFTTISSATSPSLLWQFDKHQQFEGMWLASHIRASFYLTTVPPGGQKPTASLFQASEYQLLKAVPLPLQSGVYQIDNYLPNNLVTVNEYNGNSVVGYIFQPGHGSFDQQQARQQVIEANANDQPGRRSLGSLFLGLALLAGGGIWFFATRYGRKKNRVTNSDNTNQAGQ